MPTTATHPAAGETVEAYLVLQDPPTTADEADTPACTPTAKPIAGKGSRGGAGARGGPGSYQTASKRFSELEAKVLNLEGGRSTPPDASGKLSRAPPLTLTLNPALRINSPAPLCPAAGEASLVSQLRAAKSELNDSDATIVELKSELAVLREAHPAALRAEYERAYDKGFTAGRRQ